MSGLALSSVEVIYDKVFLAIKGVSMEVGEGEMVALLGSNGAGKSTTLKAVSGLLGPERGEVTRGTITWNGTDLLRKGAPDRVDHAFVNAPFCAVYTACRRMAHDAVVQIHNRY